MSSAASTQSWLSEGITPQGTMSKSSPSNPLFRPSRNTKVQRTYSKRASKPSIQPSLPIQDTISKAINTQAHSPLKSDALPLTIPIKRSISEFFRPISSKPGSSSPALSTRQSSPIPSSPQTVASSPPSLYSQDETENEFLPKKRATRRLNSKPNFATAFTTANMNNKIQKVEKIGIENTEDYELEDIREQARSVSPDQAQLTQVTTVSGIPDSAFLSRRDGSRSNTFGASNLNNPAHVKATTGSAIASVVHNTGGALANISGPAIIVDEPATPIDTPDHGASQIVYNLDSPRGTDPKPVLTNTVGMLTAGAALDPRDSRSSGSDGDAASIRSARSIGSIDDLVGGEMSDMGDTPPNTDGAAQRRRRMTETEVSLAMPVSAGRKSRKNRSSMGFDGACDEHPARRGTISPVRRRRPELTLTKVAKVAKRMGRKPKSVRKELVQTTLSAPAHGKTLPEPKECACGFLRSTYTGQENNEHIIAHRNWGGPVKLLAASWISKDCLGLIKDKSGTTVYMYMVGNADTTAKKNNVEAVIKRAERDVGCFALGKKELWGAIQTPSSWVNFCGVTAGNVPHFKVFLGVVDGFVVSLVVAEAINEARVMKMIPCGGESEDEDEDGEGKRAAEMDTGEMVVNHKTVDTGDVVEAVMGIHYMWTHEKYRRRGIATAVLNQARRGHFLGGVPLIRRAVAWTNLTHDGERFASHYTQEADQTGWEWSYNCYQPL